MSVSNIDYKIHVVRLQLESESCSKEENPSENDEAVFHRNSPEDFHAYEKTSGKEAQRESDFRPQDHLVKGKRMAICL